MGATRKPHDDSATRDPHNPTVLHAIAQSVASRLAAEGAAAVVLTGSHATGDPDAYSDLDVIALGDGPEYGLHLHGGSVVSVAWSTLGSARATFLDPALFGTNVPGWRHAVVLHDPAGIAAALKAEAVAWTPEVPAFSAACDAWVADQVTGHAEEAHKVARSLAAPGAEGAILRVFLAARMARAIAVHHRLLYATERHLWDLVAGVMGDEWRSAQDLALGLVPSTFADSCHASLDLYDMTARATARLLSPVQQAVVSHALTLGGRQAL